MALKAYSGTGTVFLAPVNASGVKTGAYKQVGNAYPLSFQVATTQVEVLSRMVATAGQTIASKTEIDSTGGSMTLREWDAANLAWALAGTYTELTGTGADITAEAVTALAAGEYAELAHADVSDLVVKDATDTTTYVLGTDYTVNAKLGLLTILAGGDISAEDVLHCDYTYAAKSGYKVEIGTQAQIRVALKAELYNEFSGESFTLEFDSLVLSANSEINFISEAGGEGEELAFTLTAETVGSNTSPGRVNGISL
jgi:hypothetical protein